MTRRLRTTPKFGVVLCAPGDTRVLERAVCYNELTALRRGRIWKRRHPDHVVRIISLMPGDSSQPEEVPLVPYQKGRPAHV